MKQILLLFVVLLGLVVAVQARRPRIGISCSWDGSASRVTHSYVASAEKAGGLPVLIPITSDKEVIAQQLTGIDALVMTGAEDFSPLLYGEKPVQNLETVVPERDEFDLEMISQAVEQGLPILGICRGMQGMNIAFGGTLYQDIPSTYDKLHIQHRQDIKAKWGSHSIEIDKGSLLYEIIKSDKAVVNSFHHQSVARLALGFTVTARASDRIIEAMEKRDGKAPIFCVQFHPEVMTTGSNEQMPRIFEYFTNNAKR